MMRLERTPSFRLLSRPKVGELKCASNFDGGMYGERTNTVRRPGLRTLLPRHEDCPEGWGLAGTRLQLQLRRAKDGELRLPDRNPGRGHLGSRAGGGQGTRQNLPRGTHGPPRG